MSFPRTLFALALTALHSAIAISTVEVKGSKFFTSEGNQIFIKGVVSRSIHDFAALTLQAFYTTVVTASPMLRNAPSMRNSCANWERTSYGRNRVPSTQPLPTVSKPSKNKSCIFLLPWVS